MKKNEMINELSGEQIKNLDRKGLLNLLIDLEQFVEEAKKLENEFTQASMNNSTNVDINLSETKNKFVGILQKKGASSRKINKLFDELIKFSDEHSVYWQNCNVKVYENHFKQSIEKYFNKSSGIDIIDILEAEINFYLKYDKPELLLLPIISRDYSISISYFKYLSQRNQYRIKALNRMKIEFLKKEIEKEGYIAKLKNGQYITKKNQDTGSTNKSEENDDDVLNISELPDFNLLERYLLFQKLGFFDIIDSLGTKQKNKNTLMAIILKCSPYSIKKFKYDYYIKGSSDDVKDEKNYDAIDRIEDFLHRNKIVIKK